MRIKNEVIRQVGRIMAINEENNNVGFYKK